VLCLGLALYGLGTISANWLGLGLIAVAAVLFFLEVQAGSGILAVVGTLTLIAGLLVLFNSPSVPDFARLSLTTAVTVGLLSGGFFTFVAFKALGAQRGQPLTGAEGLIGKRAVVRKQFVATGNHFEGTVLVVGELWRGRAGSALEKGAPAVVTGKRGFILDVEPADD
jgi:membrane-bound serine protease (ClpP class)